MTAEEFNRLLDMRIALILDTLKAKAGEYATSDRLYNFKAGSAMTGEYPSKVLWGYLVKHLVSIQDMAMRVRPISEKAVKEKIGDAINYLILLEALFMEELEL